MVVGTKLFYYFFNLLYIYICRKLIKGSNKGTMVQKNAPEYCKVILVYTGKKSLNNEGNIYHTSSSFSNVKQNKVPTRPTYEGNYKQCTCFPVKFYWVYD